MDIIRVEFIKSSPDVKSCPAPSFPEYAFAGRSNVGKSSLINMLTVRKNLAKTSSIPGKTQCINHYLVNDAWYLVDLPGYGYARTSKAIKTRFPVIIKDYLLQRKTLACLFVLIDARREPMEIDLKFIHWAGKTRIPLVLCFTKTDKLSALQLRHKLDLYQEKLFETWAELPDFITTSSVHKKGRNEIIDIIVRSINLMNG
ncbi:MAG: YihA family ribosome biogenesis GTP-binding protein [Bacteroidales bacterium]|nr:YihA family ribosome biogenesis GTP-binding protein [Bacteroidales bacterium]